MRWFKDSSRARRSSRLVLQRLEDRSTPAGNIDAQLFPNGVLLITGDDDANTVQLKVTGSNVTLTPDVTTSINNAGPNIPAILPGQVTTIIANLGGGDDAVSILSNQDFHVAGLVKIGLGDGNNTLNFTTSGIITLGALFVTGGDGSDTVSVGGAAGSGITSAARFSFANGGSTTTLDTVSMFSLSVAAGDAVAVPNTVSLTNVTVTRGFSASLGNSNPALVSITDSTLGGLSEFGYAVTAELQNTTVNGNVLVRGVFQADLQLADTCILNRSVTVIGPFASFSASGAGSTIAGNLVLIGSADTQTSFQTLDLMEVKGAVVVRGGWFSDTFDANANFQADRNVVLNLGGGDNVVVIGDGTADTKILGALLVNGGAGNDTITFDWLTVSGATLIRTGAGADVLTIEDASTFSSTFLADLGAGDDSITIAQNTGAADPVSFNGLTWILAGAGNDSLLLGLLAFPGGLGDANSKAVFNAGLANIVDGGTGINDFDNTNAQFSGVTPTKW